LSRQAATHLRLLSKLSSLPPAMVDSDNAADELAMAEALEALPSELREVVVLRYFADLSTSTTAKLLELPAGTVKSRLYRAAESLRKSLPKPQYGAPHD
jgi:RNA polymerase sigma-70 factor (ECF subfamily)